MRLLTSTENFAWEDAGTWWPCDIPDRCLKERGWRLDEVHAHIVSHATELSPDLSACAIGAQKAPVFRWRGQSFDMIQGGVTGLSAQTTSPGKSSGIISERWSLQGLALPVAGDEESVYVMGPAPVTLVEYEVNYLFVWRRDEQG